jgi:hypothetical protein
MNAMSIANVVNGIDICISFDTTGSMYPCMTQVIRNVMKMTTQLFSSISDLRISIIAHGDYCDANNPYTIKILDLTRDESKILDFVKNVESTWGGDADECYELVLNQARTQLDWQSGRKKVLMVIGDANPHGINYPENKARLDWRNEAGLLNEAGIQVHGVHAMPGCRSSSKVFYKTIAEKTGGVYLALDQFADIVNIIMAACYEQQSEEALNEFVSIIRDNGQLNRNMKQNMNNLFRKEMFNIDSYITPSGSPAKYVSTAGLNPVPSGRFQVMPIDEITTIKDFIQLNGIIFEKGRAFYQLAKSEDVQQYKEIIMRDRETGELFNGSQVREELGLLPQVDKGGAKEKLRPTHLEKYDIFIQSTSYTRKAKAGTSILYEVSDWEMPA